MRPTPPRRRRVLAWGVASAGALVLLLLVAARLSPWPSALVIRYVFERGGAATNAALAGAVPPGILTQGGLRYDPADPGALLDLHRPDAAGDRALPLVVWLHGGGFVAGSRAEVANYARLLAADGYAVATVDYALAPGARYPTPVRQVARALAFLSANAGRLHLDATRVVLGGDSAGAQLAAQVAALASSPAYAARTGLAAGIARSRLRGVVLFCGPVDALLTARAARSSWFLRTVQWAYLGAPVPEYARVVDFSVVPHVTEAFPPAFITAGNADPLEPQSRALADALRLRGVPVDALFFPPGRAPPLGHEYQFDLSLPASREVLRRTRAFLGAALDGGVHPGAAAAPHAR